MAQRRVLIRPGLERLVKQSLPAVSAEGYEFLRGKAAYGAPQYAYKGYVLQGVVDYGQKIQEYLHLYGVEIAACQLGVYRYALPGQRAHPGLRHVLRGGMQYHYVAVFIVSGISLPVGKALAQQLPYAARGEKSLRLGGEKLLLRVFVRRVTCVQRRAPGYDVELRTARGSVPAAVYEAGGFVVIHAACLPGHYWGEYAVDALYDLIGASEIGAQMQRRIPP